MEKLIAAGERLQRDADREFEAMVEATRVGTVFAHKPDAWSRWRSQLAARAMTPTKAISARALEQQIFGVALRAPRLVAMPQQKVRRMSRDEMARGLTNRAHAGREAKAPKPRPRRRGA